MSLPFIDRNPTTKEVEKLRLILSTYQDGTGMLQDKEISDRTLPGWRDFERAVALAFKGYAQESKAIFDVLFPDANNLRTSYGLSCKMRATLDRITQDDRVTIEVSNSAGKFWDHLKARNLDQSNYRTQPLEVGKALIELVEHWYEEARTNSEGTRILQKAKATEVAIRNGGTVDVEKSSFLVLSYNKKGWYQLHQFPLVLPDPNSLSWEFTSSLGKNARDSRRLAGRDGIGVLFEWYGESGGQLKYYPFASNAKWASPQFQLESLPDTEGYGILAKARAYFPRLWQEAWDEDEIE